MTKYILALLLCAPLAWGQMIGRSSRYVPISTAAAISYTTVYDSVDADNRDAQSLTSIPYEVPADDFIHVGHTASYLRDGGAEFQLNIPKAATIDTCLVTFYVYDVSTWASTDTVDVLMYNVDNAAIFVDGHSHSIRNHAAVIADSIRWDGIAGANYAAVTAPDLARLLQVVVNRAGWAANQYIGVILQARASVTNHVCKFYYCAGGGDYNAYRARIKVVYH
jgi:hypothetical protein